MRERERRYTFCKRDGRADLGLQLPLDKRPLSLWACLRHALKSGGRQSGVDRKYPILTDSGGRGGQMEPIYLLAFLCDVSFSGRGGRRRDDCLLNLIFHFGALVFRPPLHDSVRDCRLNLLIMPTPCFKKLCPNCCRGGDIPASTSVKLDNDV